MNAWQPARAHSGRTSDQSRLRRRIRCSLAACGSRMARSVRVRAPAASSQAATSGKIGLVRSRAVILRVDRHRIGRRVVQGAEEKRVVRNRDATSRRAVWRTSRSFRSAASSRAFTSPGIAAAGPAVQRAGVTDCSRRSRHGPRGSRAGRSCRERHGAQHALRRLRSGARSSGGSKRGAGSSSAGACCRPAHRAAAFRRRSGRSPRRRRTRRRRRV